MSKIEKILSGVGVACLLLTGACSATTGSDSDADGMAGDMYMADGSTMDMGGGKDTIAAKTTYKSIVVWDKSEDPAFRNGKCGSSPGTDLDAVMLYRGQKLIGAGKVGSATYAPAEPVSTCANTKNNAANAEGPVNGKVFASNPDTGYISLNGGSVELQFGACSTATEDVTKCDGAGAVIDIQEGDELDFYEVDTYYKPGSKTAMDGFAYDSCVCYQDQYQVKLYAAVGTGTGVVLQSSAGSDTFTGTEAWPVNQKTATVKVM